VLEIFIEQDPEIRKAGRCTESTSCRIIGNTRKYVDVSMGRSRETSSSLKNIQSQVSVQSKARRLFLNRFEIAFEIGSHEFQKCVW